MGIHIMRKKGVKKIDREKSEVLKKEFSKTFRDQLLKLRESDKILFEEDGYKFLYMGHEAEIRFVVYEKSRR